MFLLEFLKEEGVYLGRVKFAQVVGFIIGVVGTVWLYRKQKRNLREDVESTIAYLISKGGKVYIYLEKKLRK